MTPSANSDHLPNTWMTRKAPHTHRLSSVLYSPQWYYFLGMYPSEKWMDHNTTTLRVEIKSLIHQRQLGIKSCKKRATQSWFWWLMDSEVEGMIEKCPTCLTFGNQWANYQPANSTSSPGNNYCRTFSFIWTLLFTNDRLLIQIYCYWNGENFTIVSCYK